MCWGYLTGRASSSLLGVSINPYLILILAALPDIDLVLGVFGIQHRTLTHSLIFWSLAFVPFFVKYRKRSIPYYLAPVQHIIFGDFIVGNNTPPLWPITRYYFNLGYNLLSPENIALEATGLALFLLLMIATKYGRTSFFQKNNKHHALNILAIVPLVSFVVFVYSYGWIADLLVDYGLLRPSRLLDSTPVVIENQLFPYALAMHVILICALSMPLVCRLITRASDMKLKNKS